MKNTLDTNAINTWCPGCGNFGLLTALKSAVEELIKAGTKKEDILITSGVGCHAKIVDYIGINTFYGLHGRSIPPAVGAKIANPNLKVIVCIGDGAAFNEGIAHLLHAAKRNIDITVLLHDNRVFALTTGQFTAISPKGFKGKSTPYGSPEDPLNPLEVMLEAQASHISRGYTAKVGHLKQLIKSAVNHKGFSFVEILQPCIAWLDSYKYYNERVYEMSDSDLSSQTKALVKMGEWDYLEGDKISIGTYYKVNKPVFVDRLYKTPNIKNPMPGIKKIVMSKI